MITNPTEIYFKDGIWGHDGTQWRRLNMLWGYYGAYAERAQNTSLPAGSSAVNMTLVSSGYVRVVDNIAFLCISATITAAYLEATIGGTTVVLDVQPAPVSGTWYILHPHVTLAAGDRILLGITGATLNDDAAIDACGYQMRVNLG